MSVICPWYQLGYIIPHLYTDLDAYQFYRIAPEGMLLVTTGLNLKEYSLAAVERELPVLRERFDLLAGKNVDRISLSGVPVAAALGRTRMLEILTDAQARTGLPCDTDLEAHIATLRHLGATKIALVVPIKNSKMMVTRIKPMIIVFTKSCNVTFVFSDWSPVITILSSLGNVVCFNSSQILLISSLARIKLSPPRLITFNEITFFPSKRA